MSKILLVTTGGTDEISSRLLAKSGIAKGEVFGKNPLSRRRNLSSARNAGGQQRGSGGRRRRVPPTRTL